MQNTLPTKNKTSKQTKTPEMSQSRDYLSQHPLQECMAIEFTSWTGPPETEYGASQCHEEAVAVWCALEVAAVADDGVSLAAVAVA